MEQPITALQTSDFDWLRHRFIEANFAININASDFTNIPRNKSLEKINYQGFISRTISKITGINFNCAITTFEQRGARLGFN